MIATTTNDDARREFTSHHQAIVRVIASRVRRRFHFATIDERDDISAEAMLDAWRLFLRFRESADNVKQAVFGAAVSAARYVKVQPRRAALPIDAAADVAGRHVDSTENIDYADTLATMPRHLRPIAELLTSGWKRSAIAKRLSTSPPTITRRCDELEIWLRERLSREGAA